MPGTPGEQGCVRPPLGPPSRSRSVRQGPDVPPRPVPALVAAVLRAVATMALPRCLGIHPTGIGLGGLWGAPGVGWVPAGD